LKNSFFYSRFLANLTGLIDSCNQQIEKADAQGIRNAGFGNNK